MHRHCLTCSADLGSNQVVEEFPLGRRLAFDAWNGRLWVVCPRCRRWNLTPIEERWEPVEALERLFRDARLRVHSQNIGLAKLPDGTMLVRVGQALEGELAAWRYGSELRRRRWKGIAVGGLLIGAVGGLAIGGLGGLAMIGVPAGLANLGIQAITQTTLIRRRRRVIGNLDERESPTGSPMVLRRLHLDGAVLSRDDEARPTLWLPAVTAAPLHAGWQRVWGPQPLKVWQVTGRPLCVLRGATAVRAMTRSMVETNRMGGTNGQIADALGLLQRAGGAEAFVRSIAEREPLLATRRADRGVYRRPRYQERRIAEDLPAPVRKHMLGERGAGALNHIEALALEMALHDERERRALRGELAALEDEWREAELIARIADSLPDEAPAMPTDRSERQDVRTR